MAIVRIPDENRSLNDPEAITAHLASIGIEYKRWEPAHAVEPDAAPEEVLAAYSTEIERLKTHGGYVAADVIDVKPETANLEALLAKFSREHWHDKNEVRFIIHGRGLFHMRPQIGPLTAIEVETGALTPAPRGTCNTFTFDAHTMS